jgi:shikimate kinase
VGNIILNKDKINISLIGMPGAGKTTIGKVLASKLSLKFIDSDHLIEKRIINLFKTSWILRDTKNFG